MFLMNISELLSFLIMTDGSSYTVFGAEEMDLMMVLTLMNVNFLMMTLEVMTGKRCLWMKKQSHGSLIIQCRPQ